jgi:hypothetical protein
MLLNKKTFVFLAIRSYVNLSCVGNEEFKKDLKIFSQLNKSLKRRKKKESFNIKLALNHIITIYNLFDDNATALLFYKIDEEYWDVIKTFLIFINRMPNDFKINDTLYNESDIPVNFDIAAELRKI